MWEEAPGYLGPSMIGTERLRSHRSILRGIPTYPHSRRAIKAPRRANLAPEVADVRGKNVLHAQRTLMAICQLATPAVGYHRPRPHKPSQDPQTHVERSQRGNWVARRERRGNGGRPVEILARIAGKQGYLAVSIMVENGVLDHNRFDFTVETLMQSYSSSDEESDESSRWKCPKSTNKPEQHAQAQNIPEERDMIDEAMKRLSRPRDDSETSEDYRRRMDAAQRQQASVRTDRETSRPAQPEPKPRSKRFKTSSEAYHSLLEAEAASERRRREAQKAECNTRKEHKRRARERSYHYDREPPPQSGRYPPEGGDPSDSSDDDSSDESYRPRGYESESDAASSSTTRSHHRQERRWRDAAHSSASRRVQIEVPTHQSGEPLSRTGRRYAAYERIHSLIDRYLEEELNLPEGARPSRLKLPEPVKYPGKPNINMFEDWLH